MKHQISHIISSNEDYEDLFVLWKHAYKNTLLNLSYEQLNPISTEKYYEFFKQAQLITE